MAKKRYIYRNGKVHRWPLNLFESARMLSGLVQNKISSELKPKALEALSDWGRRILGPKASHYLLETAMQGIYAGDALQLSASLLLGPLFENRRREKYKGVFTFPQGTGEMFQAMSKYIQKMGGKINLNQSAQLVDVKGSKVIIATSNRQAAELLKGSEVGPLISKIPQTPIVTVTAHFNESSLYGFGCLFPRGEGVRALGALMNTCQYDRGWRIWSESWIFGGATDPQILDLNDEQLIGQLVKERQKVFGKIDLPVQYRVTRWPSGLPHYNLELERVLTELNPKLVVLEQTEQVYVHGNYLGGIGLSKILDRGQKLVKRIMG